jgi:Prokaryotic Cytochrome C oxidase subunit IV
MLTNFKNPTVLVWLALVVATLITWSIGVEHGLTLGTGPSVGIVLVLAIAFLKTQIIGSVFMELRTAPVPLRFAFSGWVIGAGAMVIGIYLLA